MTLVGCQQTEEPSKRAMIEQSIYEKDAEALSVTLEQTHPLFLNEPYPAEYLEAKETFMKTAAEADSISDFKIAVSRYLTSLHDGHTTIPENLFGYTFLDIACFPVGNDLFLTDKDEKITDKTITKIGGVAVTGIFEIIDGIYPAENSTARDLKHRMSTNLVLLKLAGCTVGSSETVLTVKDGRKTSEVYVGYTDGAVWSPYSEGPSISCEMRNGYYYIDFNKCEVNEELENVAASLSKAIDAGTTKVIIDVRGNGGGNSEACERIVNAMKMATPNYGMLMRYSPLASEQHGYEKSEGYVENAPNLSYAVTNDKIDLVVLTDECTYSSATMLAVWVKDGKLGTIIGRPSWNAPSSYGDILNYSLPSTGIKVTISYKQYLRPDSNADPNTLTPDILTDVGEDSLDVAVNFLKKQ